MPGRWRVVRAIAPLPFVATVIVPAIIVASADSGWDLDATALVVSLGNGAYLPLVEEPALVRRFGAEYERYMAKVPRWLPRLRPWRQ